MSFDVGLTMCPSCRSGSLSTKEDVKSQFLMCARCLDRFPFVADIGCFVRSFDDSGRITRRFARMT